MATTLTWAVDIIESEAGWGSKVDETLTFPTKEEAAAFATDYNTKYNPPGPTPEWYMYAGQPYPKEVQS